MSDHKTGASDGRLPQRKTTYAGRLTDTNRWDLFQARENDIFICTPPKCGTTWTQAICAFLIFDTPNFDGKLTNISPWVDSKLESADVCMGALNAQGHRRFVKTHTPLDGIPYFDNGVYLIVYRDPRDVYFSIRNHLFNMVNPPDIPQLAANPRDGFRAWIEAPFEPGVGEQRSLEAFVHHFQSYWHFRHIPNFHFLHFSNMKKDLSANFQRIADILQIQISPKRLDELCEAASFAEMKKSASSFSPGSGKAIFKNDESFFSGGKNKQWGDILGPDDLELYAKRIREFLSPAEVAWVENGDKKGRRD